MIFMLLLITFGYFRESHDIYSQVAIQYLSYFFKKLSIQLIRDRIKRRMFYDDIIVILVFTYCLDLVFAFNALVLRKQTPFSQSLILFNFLNIWLENILDENPIVEMYKKCLEEKLLLLINIPIIYGIVRYITLICELIVKGLSKIYVMAILTFFYAVVKRVFSRFRDNQRAEEMVAENIELNGYSKYSIIEQDIPHLICQLSVISLLHFLAFQLLMVITKVLIESSSELEYYLAIYKFRDSYESGLNVHLNFKGISIFNAGMVFVTVFIIYSKESDKLKAVK
jgi:hypothetical protein